MEIFSYLTSLQLYPDWVRNAIITLWSVAAISAAAAFLLTVAYKPTLAQAATATSPPAPDVKGGVPNPNAGRDINITINNHWSEENTPKLPSPTQLPMPIKKVPAEQEQIAQNNTINAPNNTGIITNNQSGGTNIINQGPSPLGMTPDQSAQLSRAVRQFSTTIDGPIKVWAVMGSQADVMGLRDSIVRAIEDGGGKAESGAATWHMKIERGVTITAGVNWQPFGTMIMRTLIQSGVVTKVTTGGSDNPDEFLIVVAP